MILKDRYQHEDENDVDEYGMDPITRRRLRVKMKSMAKGKKKPLPPQRTRMPYSLSHMKDVKHESVSLQSRIDFLSEAIGFITPGKRGYWKHDPVGYVVKRFFKSTPELENSLVQKQARRNGWTLNGAWPSSGKHIFDWEIDAWGERGGMVVLKFSMWSAKGGIIDGLSFKTNVGMVDKLIPKFLRKYFYPMKAQAKARMEE